MNGELFGQPPTNKEDSTQEERSTETNTAMEQTFRPKTIDF